jgi:hypothetical protein
MHPTGAWKSLGWLQKPRPLAQYRSTRQSDTELDGVFAREANKRPEAILKKENFLEAVVKKTEDGGAFGAEYQDGLEFGSD